MHLGPNGGDRVEFMWSANKGQGLKSLMKIASGGELSRLMLAVKRVCVSDLVSSTSLMKLIPGLEGAQPTRLGVRFAPLLRASGYYYHSPRTHRLHGASSLLRF